MRDSRLFQITYYLLNKGQTTAPKLAEKFEVSIRTIYRDIDSLSNAGIPIYTVQGKGGRHCFTRGIHTRYNYIILKYQLK